MPVVDHLRSIKASRHHSVLRLHTISSRKYSLGAMRWRTTMTGNAVSRRSVWFVPLHQCTMHFYTQSVQLTGYFAGLVPVPLFGCGITRHYIIRAVPLFRHSTTFVSGEKRRLGLETAYPWRRPSCASPTCTYAWQVVKAATAVTKMIRDVLPAPLRPPLAVRFIELTRIWWKQGGTTSGTLRKTRRRDGVPHPWRFRSSEFLQRKQDSGDVLILVGLEPCCLVPKKHIVV